MTLPRLASSYRKSRRRLSLPIEPLEARQLMAAKIAAAVTPVLVDGPARDVGSRAGDHTAAWYTPVSRSSTGGHSAGGDVVPAGTSFQVNAAGLPLLTSRADNAGLKIFLDFDGYGTDLPFSTDGDTSTFNAGEQTNIYDTWRDIVSYFAPFNVNVTTIQPPTGGGNPAFIWQRISNSIVNGAAYVGAIDNSNSNGWVEGSFAVSRHSGIAHEIGHQLGLSHQAEQDTQGVETTDYSDGYDNRDRPIMGVDFAENIRRWYYGRNSDNALNLQDEMAIISATVSRFAGGDGYRVDDFAGTLASAALVPASGMIAGITERIDDVDVFKFTSTGGTYQIAATPTFESSASPKIELLDASGRLLAARDDADRRNTNNNGQEFSLNLAAGTYYARVTGGGDYAEQGEYLLTAAPLPSGWTSQDVGANTIYRPGTAAFDPANNTLTQLGGGTDIWSTTDEFRFTSTTLAGDGSITARIDSLDNVDFNAKAGVMIRASNLANTAHVYLGIKPSGQLDPIVRTSGGVVAAAVGNPSGATGPWVRLTRTGNVFTLERSSDGISWSTYSTTTVTMGAQVLIGFATNSRSTHQAAYATFSNISVTGTLGATAPSYNALAAPADLSAVPATGASTAIVLNWSAVDGNAGYAVERSFDGVNYTVWTTTPAGVTTYTDANLFGSMRYFYRVTTMASSGPRSVPSTAVSAINKPSAPTATPANYQPAVMRSGGTQLLLNWNDVQGDAGYRVERSITGGSFAMIGTTGRNLSAFNDSGLAPGTSYTYRVTPLTSVGDGIAPSWTLTTSTPIDAPANFRVAAHTASSMSLAWSDSNGELQYQIERSTDAKTWSALATLAANTTTYTDTNVSPFTRYYYRLRAVESSGGLGLQALALGATLPTVAPPTGWTSTDVGTPAGLGASTGMAGGAWSVIGSGADVWGAADQFHYLNRVVTGNGSIVAHLTNLDNTDFYVKAGVMFRESAAANSPYVFMHYSSGPGLQFEYRDSAGSASGNGFIANVSARWLRLTRAGNVFTAAYSDDGVSWTNAASRTVAMSTAATMGLAATSHNVGLLTLANFDNVTTTGTGANAAPIITTAAAANPSPVTSTTATLNVSATDDGGAANLTYLWSTLSKPAAVADPTFSVNNANGANTTLATFSAAGQYTMRVTVRDAQGLTATSDVNVVVSLRSLGGAYDFDKPQPQLVVPFNGNIAARLSSEDLVMTNLTTGATIPASAITTSFDTTTNAATFRFAGNALPDGNYRATLAAGSVAEPSGVTLGAPTTVDFFVLAGDANRDRVVNFSDLVIVAQNYNQAGKLFSGGNFDYDAAGRVDFADLVLLAQRYGTSLLPAAPAASVAAISSAAPKNKTRVATTVL